MINDHGSSDWQLSKANSIHPPLPANERKELFDFGKALIGAFVGVIVILFGIIAPIYVRSRT
jgi:hypothetical protein